MLKNMVQEILIRNFVLRPYIQARGEKVNFSNFASLFFDAFSYVYKSCFVFFFFLLAPKLSLQYDFGFPILSKVPYTSAGP